MAVKGMTVFRANGEDYTLNDPNIADEFSTSKNYRIGSVASYQGNLYVFTTPHPAGSWNSAHVERFYVGERLTAQEADGVKNMANFLTRTSGTHNDITYTWTGDVCNVNGTASSDSVNILFNSTKPSSIVDGDLYRVRYETTDNNIVLRIICKDSDSETLATLTYANGASTFLVPEGTTGLNIALFVGNGKQISNAKVRRVEISKELSNGELTNTAMMRYVGKPPSTIFDLPANCWYYTTGSTMQSILGADFPYTLNSSVAYVVTKKEYTPGYYQFELVTSNRTERYIGNTAVTHPTDPYWKRAKADGNVMEEDDDIAVRAYTEFELIKGWYHVTEQGATILIYTSDDTVYFHTNLVKVKPGETLYTTSVIDRSYDGAWFDANGNLIGALAHTDLTEYEYDKPNGDPDSTLTAYMTLRSFTVPADAHYLSWNVPTESGGNRYRTCISNIPVFFCYNTGNVIIKKTDPEYVYFSKRKLCVIGPSTVMIDRLARTGNFENNGSSQTQCVCGFQEYLMPYWADVRSFGYSSAGYANYNKSQGAGNDSIYKYIVTNELDLSDYDDFLFVSSGNNMDHDSIGSLSSYTDQGDNTTYIGALRQIITYIYGQNPQAKIYLQGVRHYGAAFGSGTYWDKMEDLDDAIKGLSRMLGCKFIDLMSESGWNQYTVGQYSYDANPISSGGHWNHIGAREIGLVTRRAIIGV